MEWDGGMGANDDGYHRIRHRAGHCPGSPRYVGESDNLFLVGRLDSRRKHGNRITTIFLPARRARMERGLGEDREGLFKQGYESQNNCGFECFKYLCEAMLSGMGC